MNIQPQNLKLCVICFMLACNSGGKTNKELAADTTKKVISCSSAALTTDLDWYSSGKKAPLLWGLEGVDFKISTTNKETQVYFNQGMMLAYAFNHAEAARSFYEAIRLDSNCAMAYWGYAYVLGPNYNAGMEEGNYQRAYNAVIKAQKLAIKSTPKEKVLIEAILTRYTMNPPADRNALDIAYAAAMEKVFHLYPDDPDIGALYVESLMNLHPWDLYEKKSRTPKKWTPELIEILEHLIKKNAKHPGAHHFYIHAMEASSTPEKALPSAELLYSLVPGAGHLIHMPSHIYINTGDYHLGTLSNIQAVKVDSIYTNACHAQGAYPLAYYPHNYHFLAATATLEGNSKLAWSAAQTLQQHTNRDIMQLPGWGTLQHYYTIPYYVAAKLSMWDTILSLPAPPQQLVYPNAIWHYAKGMAYIAKNNVSNARQELLLLEKLAADTSLQQLTVWDINTTADLVLIASKVLSAAIAVKQKQVSLAENLLTEAVAQEDNLNYNEPPDWFFSVRHHLGAVLIKNGKYGAAEEVYRQDLKTWRKNGWALIGLNKVLTLQNKYNEAVKINAAFNEAWKYADFNITSSSTIVD